MPVAWLIPFVITFSLFVASSQLRYLVIVATWQPPFVVIVATWQPPFDFVLAHAIWVTLHGPLRHAIWVRFGRRIPAVGAPALWDRYRTPVVGTNLKQRTKSNRRAVKSNWEANIVRQSECILKLWLDTVPYYIIAVHLGRKGRDHRILSFSGKLGLSDTDP